ncbi:amidase [Phytohalomonas tamaricis]|uniref:amidase n=1 Tax=Phytohalomonas tamaricis TaxID=2081032 RepID=UPI000D0B3CF9|nr:amidase [Phytohalomonas tamaricis]
MTTTAQADAFWQRAPRSRRLRDLEAAYQRGDFSPQEASEALIRRVESLPEVTRATYIAFEPNRLRDSAPAQWQLSAGPLAGVPVSIKDLFDTTGEVTRAGSRVLAGAAPAERDASAVARLRSAGAQLCGRTTMTEFAFSGLGLNPHYGSPPNPFDGKRITGGSSSGGAASVAFGLAAATLGSDTGGSLRIPAAFCGLTGFKPSQASVPLDGAYPLAPSLDCVGPIAPSVDCCARLWSVLARRDMPTLDETPRPLRLAVPEGGLLEELDIEVAQAFALACDYLRAQGCHLEHLTINALDAVYAINQRGGLVVPEAAALHREQLARHGALYDPQVYKRLEGGLDIPAHAYIERLQPRAALQRDFCAELVGFDAVLLPTAPLLPPERERLEQESEVFIDANRRALRNTNVFNYLDAAALSLPFIAPGAALPIGLMVAAPQGEDARLLQTASVLEAWCERFAAG